MNHVHLHCLILPGNWEGMWLQSFRGSGAHNQLGHCGAYPEVWHWAAVEKMNWAIFYRAKSIASEQPATPAAGAGGRRREPGGGKGALWEKTRTLWWREDTEVSQRVQRRAKRKEGSEIVVPERIWTKPLYPSYLKLPPLLRALSVVVGNVRK